MNDRGVVGLFPPMRNAVVLFIALSACSEKVTTPGDNNKPPTPQGQPEPLAEKPPTPGSGAQAIAAPSEIPDVTQIQYRELSSNSGSQELYVTLNLKTGDVTLRSEEIYDSHAGRVDVLKTAEGVLDSQEIARFRSAVTSALLSQLDKDCERAEPGPDGVYMQLSLGETTKQCWCKRDDGKQLPEVAAFSKSVDAFAAALGTPENAKRFKLNVRDRSDSKPQPQ